VGFAGNRGPGCDALPARYTPGIRHLRSLWSDEQLQIARERGIHYMPYLALGLVPIYAVLLQCVPGASPARVA
jgi:hypothetical protein